MLPGVTLSPSGGSLVSLMEACRREMGNGRSSVGGASADKNNLRSKKVLLFLNKRYRPAAGHRDAQDIEGVLRRPAQRALGWEEAALLAELAVQPANAPSDRRAGSRIYCISNPTHFNVRKQSRRRCKGI